MKNQNPNTPAVREDGQPESSGVDSDVIGVAESVFLDNHVDACPCPPRGGQILGEDAARVVDGEQPASRKALTAREVIFGEGGKTTVRDHTAVVSSTDHVPAPSSESVVGATGFEPVASTV